jgi:hypothetical protein
MAVNGVESVNVSLEKGLAAVKLKPGNTVTLKQLQAAITRNGFTMKESHIVAGGKLVGAGGNTKFQISGSNEELVLTPESPGTALPAVGATAALRLEGIVPEAAKNKVPDSVRYQSVTEEK